MYSILESSMKAGYCSALDPYLMAAGSGYNRNKKKDNQSK
jgi:hypothetical protein